MPCNDVESEWVVEVGRVDEDVVVVDGGAGLAEGGVSITEDEEARVLLGARAPTSASQPLSPFFFVEKGETSATGLGLGGSLYTGGCVGAPFASDDSELNLCIGKI